MLGLIAALANFRNGWNATASPLRPSTPMPQESDIEKKYLYEDAELDPDLQVPVGLEAGLDEM